MPAASATDQMTKIETNSRSADERATMKGDDDDVASLHGFNGLPAELQLVVADFADDATVAALNRVSRRLRLLTTPLLPQRALLEVPGGRSKAVSYVRQAIKRNQVEMLQRLLVHNVPLCDLSDGFRESIRFLGMNIPPPKLDAFRLVTPRIHIMTDHLSLAALSVNGTGVLETLLPLVEKDEINRLSDSYYDLPLLAAAEFSPGTDTIRLLLEAGADPSLFCTPGRYSRFSMVRPMNAITRALFAKSNRLQKVQLLESYGESCESIPPENLPRLMREVLAERREEQEEGRALIDYVVDHGCFVDENTLVYVLSRSFDGTWSFDFVSRLLDASGRPPNYTMVRDVIEQATFMPRTSKTMEIAGEVVGRASLDVIESYWDVLAAKLVRLMVAVGDGEYLEQADVSDEGAMQNHLDLQMLRYWKELEILAILTDREDELWWWSSKTIDPRWLAFHGLERSRS